MEFNLIEVLLLFISVYLLFKVIKLENQIKGMKYTLNQIIKQADAPEKPIDNELRQLLDDGKDVNAVKRVRETLGLSLLEAKQYVDALKFEGK